MTDRELDKYPVLSGVQMIQAVRTASDDAPAEGRQLLAGCYEDHPELAADKAITDLAIIRVAVNDDVE
jgi:hypothetical protein